MPIKLSGIIKNCVDASNEHDGLTRRITINSAIRSKAAAIVADVTSTESLLRVQPGTDSLARVEAKLAQVASELAIWRTLAESTDYEQMSQAVTA